MCRSPWTSVSATTGRKPRTSRGGSPSDALFLPANLEPIPLGALLLRRQGGELRALGDDDAEDEAIEVGAQRGAVIRGQRRADPPGLGRVPGALQVALRARGDGNPVR